MESHFKADFVALLVQGQIGKRKPGIMPGPTRKRVGFFSNQGVKAIDLFHGGNRKGKREKSRIPAAQFRQEIVEGAGVLLFIQGGPLEDPPDMGIVGPVGNIEIKIDRFQFVFDRKLEALPIILRAGPLGHHRPMSGELFVYVEELLVMFDFIPPDFQYAVPLFLRRGQPGQRVVIADGLVFPVDRFRNIRNEAVHRFRAAGVVAEVMKGIHPGPSQGKSHFTIWLRIPVGVPILGGMPFKLRGEGAEP